MSKRLTCLIVEDEPIAAKILQRYIEDVNFLDCVGLATNSLEALELLKREQVDLLFLDLNLPKITGFELLRSLPDPPKVIVTTAYHQHALEGFELGVLDYLMKPISFPRFLQAVSKAYDAVEGSDAHLFVNVNKTYVRVKIDDILYIESVKDYVQIVTPSQSIKTKAQLGDVLTSLPDGAFIQTHRSFAVAKQHMDSVSSEEVRIGDHSIPVGRSFKDGVMSAIKKFN